MRYSKRNNIYGLLFFLIVIAGIVFMATGKEEKNDTKKDNLVSLHEKIDFTHDMKDVTTSYIANVKVNPGARTIDGTLNIRATNDTGKPQDHIYFHLYPNAFRNTEKLKGPVWESVLGRNPKPGWIDVRDIKVDGNGVQTSVNETILDIPLTNWANGDNTDIEMEFHIQIPKNNLRLSYSEHILWLGNWLPIRAKYDDEGWNLDPYYPMGDPFYSDVANYQLQVHVPEGYQIASTGTELAIDEGDNRTYTVRANRVRDIAMTVMDNNYEMIKTKINDTEVHTWYMDSDDEAAVKELHESASKSIAYFSKNFGDYPYPDYDVIRTGGFFGGMEYPGLVFIEGSLFEGQGGEGIITVAHETAHQWWYGLVGNDEVEEPWLDESLTQYSTLQFLMSEYPSVAEHELLAREASISGAKMYEERGEFISSPVTAFSDWRSYGQLVYNKGPQMFYVLEQAIGKETMNKVLSAYFEKYEYGIATGENLIAEFEQAVGPAAKDYFESWLNGGKEPFKG